ncbi:MAG: 2-oxoacid:acceptor oxidoreductase family protein [Spirochaetales bacterium]|nr:2-oxoacid:acceptor oxidoreductase family protein [Leptospiraceae bacterium]MCP5481521.1 2-oxoacid:acceptor oxidoreductase family protein [Spirochaetales bacterium]MCP5484349.1 2-oxoacid:acceptor oxidoreductase family protein [Spirochaetales bacterium]
MKKSSPEYPGIRSAVDGNQAVVLCERESSDAAGAFPITPSTQMGEHWAEEAARGHINISERPLIFIEPEGEHAAAAVTAGLSMTGLRAANFSSSQGIAYMHESLYAAVGKRLTYVLNMGCRAIAKASLSVHASHDDYHCVDDTGFFQMFAKDVQQSCDLNIIAHRIAELALTPGIVAQDGFLTTHVIESILLPERELIQTYLGRPDDMIATPTPAQRMLFGETRRRIPELWSVDNPVMSGIVQNQDAHMQSVAAQRPFFFDHIAAIADQSFEEFQRLTGRPYARVLSYRADDADYLILGQGSMIPTAEAVVDYLRESRGLKVGVVNLIMFRPFPGDILTHVIKGKKAVAVLERTDQPLAEDLPLLRELRSALGKSFENGRHHKATLPYPGYATCTKIEDAPELYSGSYGMGGRDLQPEGVIAAVENMLADGARRKLYYLSIDFIRLRPLTPVQQAHQDTIAADYPNVAGLALHGSENPNLMPPGSITVRFHSVGGWGAITTGKNLAMTLFDLLGYHIKAHPRYGSEKKGQPTTYYLSAAPEPIRVNCDFYYVDAVLSPDPNVFSHTNALAGLRNGGLFIIQSEREDSQKVWEDIPESFQKIIRENNLRVVHLDGFKVAREEATDPELERRMQGIAFQGAFFAHARMTTDKGLSGEKLFAAIEEQLRHKFGSQGERIVQDNLRVVRRGYKESREISEEIKAGRNAKKETRDDGGARAEPALPLLLSRQPKSEAALSDIHRFWAQTGNFYIRGQGEHNLADPFIALSQMPPVSAIFRDMTGIRFEHPEWSPENCTGCAKCWTVCPDTAIPGLVNSFGEVCSTAMADLEEKGQKFQELRRALSLFEKNFQELAAASPESQSVRALIKQAIAKTTAPNGRSAEQGAALRAELEVLEGALHDYPLALTRPFFTLPEKQNPNSGGLLSLSINPTTCKGCAECVQVCNDDALRMVPQTKQSVQALAKARDFWLRLPDTDDRFVRIDDLEEGVGILETMLLKKDVSQAVVSGDGACLGCTEKTVMRLFVGAVEALMQPRVRRHVLELEDLIAKLEKHIELKLMDQEGFGNTGVVLRAIGELKAGDVSLSDLSQKIDELTGSHPIDTDWLQRTTKILAQLRDLHTRYIGGTTGKGRTKMGMLNATGCTSVWGSSWPFNPYPFPWANHLFQDSPSMAMGIFEGHMAKMADGFKAVRRARLELGGGYRPAEHDEGLQYFNWRNFSDEEFHLCPPVVVVGGDGAMYDIGFQNLSRAMISGKPLKILVMDTQVYSNTGGQACTSGFPGQISDMAQYGKAIQGKQEIRKELALIAIAHRNTYVHQSNIYATGHLLEGFIHGLNSRHPALFNIYCACQPEHGIGDDRGAEQARLAMESRAYPAFRYDPDLGDTAAQCLDLSGNPQPDRDWAEYELQYTEDGVASSMQLPMTFADFALTETRFRKHFRKAPPETWNESMVPLADFLELSKDDRADHFPYVWGLDRKNQLSRLMVSETIVEACEDRRQFWRMLQAMAGGPAKTAGESATEEQLRQKIVSKLVQGLLELTGDTTAAQTIASDSPAPTTAESTMASASTAGGMAPWIDSAECTSCDECIKINREIFAYNAEKKAYVKNPTGGPYSDLVRAAEKCTASVIHPGLPATTTPENEKWIKRGEKYN